MIFYRVCLHEYFRLAFVFCWEVFLFRSVRPALSQSTCMHGRGGLSLDLNPACLRVNATNLDHVLQDLDQNPRVNGAYMSLLDQEPRRFIHAKRATAMDLIFWCGLPPSS